MVNAQSSGAESSKRSGALSVFPFDAQLMSVNGNMFETATKAGRAYVDAAVEINKEIMNFASTRVREDVVSAHSLINSKNSEEAFLVQADFVETAIKEYADEGARLMHIAASAAKKILTPFEDQALDALHELQDQTKTEASPKRGKTTA